jgi:hypothetical protein
LLRDTAGEEEDKSRAADSPKLQYLLKNLVSDLQHLSFASKLQERMPKELHEYLRAETANHRYASADDLGYADAQIILDRIKEKATAEQLSNLIKASSSHIEATGDLLLDIVMRTILSLTQYSCNKPTI